MPELPEVERARCLAASVAERRVIDRVRCADDRIVIEGVTPPTLTRKLVGRRVLAVRRHGKHLWFELDRPPMPLFHLGMTGAFHIPDGEHLPLQSSIDPGEQWPPRFWKIQIEFSDGGQLAMTNARRFGRIRLRECPEHEPPIDQLGFDPLLDLPSTRSLIQQISTRRASLKGLLLDQSFAAGVGNWIADEVLYQAGLDPRRKADSLTTEEIAELRRVLGRVIRTAVRVNADKSRFPKSWLFHVRWNQNTQNPTLDGESVQFLRVAGRTTAWIPSRQH
ncbi:MAG: DNA-formamidopyrimidine glycosylase family protein [Planctomycetota bacterium]|nr:DNA-formamidopyrimidine glycosylase family protein [Planctomycetota bacterium]